MKIKKQLVINRDWCKGCGICVAYCPRDVLALDEDDKVTAPKLEDCIYCKLCELRCPDFAIEVREVENG
jgi:2-oxoglutarate ferredoxin oxidoreductase subunit delta